MSIVLPAAPPERYLRWMAYWREVEQAIAARPALEEFASAEGVPLVHGPIVEFISTVVVKAVSEQAAEAKRVGAATLEPVIRNDLALLREANDYVVRRLRWLEQSHALDAIGIAPLEPEIEALREDVLREVEQQLG